MTKPPVFHRPFRPTRVSSVPPLTLVLSLWLVACAPGSEAPTGNVASADVSSPDENSLNSASPASADAQSAAPDAVSFASPKPVPKNVLGLEGLGDLRIGQSVPDGSSWGERGAQTSEGCRTVTSPEYPGAYAIVSDGKVRRITLGKRSNVKLAEGVGVGATRKDVDQWFAGFRAEPHKYEDAPATYLTAPNAASGDPALRFEIGQDGKVSLIHVGTMPVLGYVEGCS